MTELEFHGHPMTLPDEPKILTWFTDEAAIRNAYWCPSPGDVVLDIGCHIGGYAIPALVSGARVLAVDPSTQATDELAALVAMNPQIDPGRLVIVNQALAEEGGYPLEVRDGLDSAPWPSMYPAPDAEFSTVDRLVRKHHLTRLDWVKIDVEGGEASVLRGGLRTWCRFRPTLLIEDHTEVYPFVEEMDSAGQCLDLLERIGYRVTTARYVDPRGLEEPTPDRNFWICYPAP